MKPTTRTCSLLLAGLLAGALPAPAQPAVTDAAPEPGLPAAQELLDQVVARLPDVPLRVRAQMQSRPREGGAATVLNAEMLLDWHAAEPSARYTFRDAFGAPLEALQVLRPAEGGEQYLYYRGDPLQGAPAPWLYDAIQGTDINWIDLSFAYLWWPYGRTIGREELKGRACYVVELPTPGRATNTYAGVRIWIDPQAAMLLQLTALDERQEEIKKMQIKSFKKINDVWMIKDLEVQDLRTGHRTYLRVRDVEKRERAPAAEDDGAAGPETPAEEVAPVTPAP